jgi:hypothetical protein
MLSENMSEMRRNRNPFLDMDLFHKGRSTKLTSGLQTAALIQKKILVFL